VKSKLPLPTFLQILLMPEFTISEAICANSTKETTAFVSASVSNPSLPRNYQQMFYSFFQSEGLSKVLLQCLQRVQCFHKERFKSILMVVLK